jgi:sarcosine oxidase, subunit gamma
VIAHTALAGRSADLALAGGVEIAFPTQVDVRAPDPPPGFPAEPNTWSRAGERDVLWLGPDEWLVVAAPGEADTVVAELRTELASRHHSVVDVSSNRVVIELAGASRLELLSSSCPLDLDPRIWVEGRCAQTLFGAAPVLLQERAGDTRLLVRPSFAHYVVDLLLAGVER